MASNNIIMIA